MTGQVSRMQGQTPNSEMGVIGYIIAAGVGLMMLPLLPLLVVLWLASELGSDEERESGYAS